MKNYELLSPAGDFSCLRQAVFNGADAVYLGGKKFGARKFAANFEDEEMIEAIRFCHLYGVKLYVTVNTMIYDEEIDECIDYLTFLHKNGVDAVIMQDIGLISLTRKILPNLEIHASTQAHNHNRDGLEELKELGVTRCVLARELTLEEIDKLDVEIEKEVFIHGALCVSYSGQCLFSSMLLDRSGNRGSCAGICRLPFELIKNGVKVDSEGLYLLSTKELNTSSNFIELLKRDITSFKIEGRMKGPSYVGWITKFYRNIIDQYQKTGSIVIDEQELKEMKLLYNREFTSGWLFPTNHDNITNIKTPNHIGIPLGKVVEITDDKIKIKLEETLNQEDGIRFSKDQTGMMVNFLYDENGLLVNQMDKGTTVVIDKKCEITSLQDVWKTSSIKLIKELEKLEEKKIPISIEASLEVLKPISITVSDEIEKVSVTGIIVEEAKTSPMSKERIEEQLEKTGQTPFKVEKMTVSISGNIFISIKELNELRRKALDILKEKRELRKKEVLINQREVRKIDQITNACKISVLVRTEEQLKAALEENVDFCYVTDEVLYEKYKGENIYFRTPRVRQEELSKQPNLLISEFGGMRTSPSKKRVDFYLNISNHESIWYYKNKGAESVCLSVEMKNNQVENIMKMPLPTSCEIEMLVYGYIEVMIMKYCPVNKVMMQGKKPCALCKKNSYELKDRNKSVYLLEQENETTHIFYHRPIKHFDDVALWKKLGVSIFRLDFLEENASYVKEKISELKSLLK